MAGQRKQPRAYELAKEMGVPIKDFVAKLAENGVAIKSNFSVMGSDEELLARKLFRPLSGGLQAARELEEKKKAEEQAKLEAAAAEAKAREEAAKPKPAPKPAAAAPARPAAKPTPSSAPKPASHARPHAAAKPAASPKTPPKPVIITPKGPQPATQPMPGLLSKPPPLEPPPAPAAPAAPAEPPAVAAAPLVVAAPPTRAPAPATPKAAALTAPARAEGGPAPASEKAPARPVSSPRPPRTEPRPAKAQPAGRPPAPKPQPAPPPRPLFYGPSPAPADYDQRPRAVAVPRPPAAASAAPAGGAGPQIRPQTPAGAPSRITTGRPSPGGAPAGPGQRPAQPGTPGQKTIFRFDEKEEERKRRDREKELAKEAERQRRDAAREAHKKKQESYQARARQRDEQAQQTPSQPEAPAEPQLQSIRLPDSMIVSELASQMRKTPIEVVTKLISMGTMASINQRIDFETASLLANEFGFNANLAEEDAELAEESEKPSDPSKLVPRPPVVTVMGHVDHGKTSLLDAIRHAKVAAGEFGGITQHIGAYTVKLPDGHNITFLDTPGHEAFTAMRAHGAKVTDCAVLVVAADDGVMPQTEEAIHHAQAAGVPIIVAINKIDKAGANPERVKQELTKLNLVPEEWGGKTICVNVSATKNTNLQQLLEMIVLQSEMLELKADPTRPGRGVIIESRLEKGRGPVATVLIQEGTLRAGDAFAAGTAWGKVRALMDDLGRKVKEAGPGQPVNVMGFDSVPDVATTFQVVDGESAARDLVARRLSRKKAQKTAATPHLSLEDLFSKVKEGTLKELKVIIKADTNGSVTALSDALGKVSNEEVKVSVIHGGVGAITETDVMFAAASEAIIVGFHVRPAPQVQKLAQQEKVDIRLYSIIYEAVEEIESAIKGMLAPKYQEVVFGHAEVRQAFSVPKVGRIAGSYVLDGKIVRNGDARVIRDGVEVYSGKIASLRRFKEDTKEVAMGFECGIGLEKFTDVKEKDIIEVFRRQEIPRD